MKKKRNKKLLLYKQTLLPEEAYQLALDKIETLDVIVRPQDMAKACKDIIRLFKVAGDYQNAREQIPVFKAKVAEEKRKGKELDYARAIRRMENAVSDRDYKRAEEDFRNLKGFLDSERKAAECAKLRFAVIKKENMKLAGKTAAILAVIVGIMGGRYFYAQHQERLAAEEEERRQEERTILEKLDIKDTAYFGGHDWCVVDKDEEKITLIGIHSGTFEDWSDRSFHNTYEETDWEHSDLRAWLNGEFLENSFTDEERARIILTENINCDNPVYGTDGGADTQDYVYLPSYDDILKYDEIVKTMKLTWLLRTPGNDASSVMFMKQSEPELYGYAVDSAQYNLRPMMQVKLAEIPTDEE